MQPELDKFDTTDTPEFSPYPEEDQNKMTFLDLDKEIKPKVGNVYISASIMLPHRNQMIHSLVKAHMLDVMATLLGANQTTPSLTHVFMKLSSQMVRLLHLLEMQLCKQSV